MTIRRLFNKLLGPQPPYVNRCAQTPWSFMLPGPPTRRREKVASGGMAPPNGTYGRSAGPHDFASGIDRGPLGANCPASPMCALSNPIHVKATADSTPSFPVASKALLSFLGAFSAHVERDPGIRKTLYIRLDTRASMRIREGDLLFRLLKLLNERYEAKFYDPSSFDALSKELSVSKTELEVRLAPLLAAGWVRIDYHWLNLTHY